MASSCRRCWRRDGRGPSIFSSRCIVTRRAAASGAWPERYARRFAVAIVLGGVIWGAFLISAMRLFVGDEPAPHAPQTIRMQLVELPPPAPAAPPATHEEPQAAPSRSIPLKPASVRPAAPAKRIEAAQSHDAQPAQQPVTSTPSQTAHAAPDDARPASAAKVESAATHPAASGNAQARLLSQPLPVLPDDLREDGYQAVAVARFLVHADGTFDIDLVKPTPNPRLNQILLETLRRWRFFPAMDNGRPVESRQDVRVHFNVN
ncbi:energy transducer TonB [Burkholderia ubonensis]|uniref:energy transducer TonB n=1 Tax=Burkholderia ubonensis TaxID=101571 RepID=UPI001E34E274|nr:energy transducer TonB [Burkholderia ubonensis]